MSFDIEVFASAHSVKSSEHGKLVAESSEFHRVAELVEAEEKCEGVMTPDNILTQGQRKGKETAGRISSEDRDTVI